jgi:hypothetical protein
MATKKTPLTKHGWLMHSCILRIPPCGDDDNISNVYVELHVSKYAWTEKGIWCGRMDKVGSVTRIIHHMDGKEDLLNSNAIRKRNISFDQVTLL